MEILGSGRSSGLSEPDKGPSRGRLGRRRVEDDQDTEHKSKNVHTERRRREKLSARLLTLRSLVPIITNMNKATIIEDAITYIQQLQNTSMVLSEELLGLEGPMSEEGDKPMAMSTEYEHAAEDMKKCGIKEEINVTQIDGKKLLIKIVLVKKRGCFTKLIEAMNGLGFELSETSVTSIKGAMLFSSCVQNACGDTSMVNQQTQKLLLEIISGITGISNMNL